MNKNYVELSELKSLECPDATYFAKDHSLVMTRGRGSEVWDREDKRYLDFCAGFGVLALGHNPEVYREIWTEYAAEQIPFVMHAMGDVYPGAFKTDIMRTLLAALPSKFAKAVFALSGSQAVELAMKTASLATGGSGFICFQQSYHGLDLGALNLTSRQDFRAPFEELLLKRGTYFCKFPQSESELLAELQKSLGVFAKQKVKPAALIVEPVQGRAGIRPFAKSYLQIMRDFCDQNRILLIYDEIFCGLGRCGRMSFAELVPSDLSCFGKALGGGLPLSACVGTAEAMNAWPENPGEALHAGTFFGHPLSCRLGLKTINAIVSQNFLTRVNEIGQRALSWLQDALRDQPLVKEVRGQGLMLGIEFARPGVGAQLMDTLRARGLIILPSGPQGECLSITPALNIEWEQLVEGLSLVVTAANEIVLPIK